MSIKPDNQLALFSHQISDILKEFNLNNAIITQWYELGYLSFDFRKKNKITEPEFLELHFVSGLFNSGMSLNSIEFLLSKLDKPYSYHLNNVYFNFSKKEWEYLPQPETPTIDNISEMINEVLDDIDVKDYKETLEGIINDIKEKLDEL